jgi:hypothetical protein
MHDDDLVELEVLGVRRHPGDDALVVLLLEPVGELIVPRRPGPSPPRRPGWCRRAR